MRLSTLVRGDRRIVGSEAHHLANVLRVRIGQEGRAFDGTGMEAAVTVVGVERDHVDVQVGDPEPSSAESSLQLRLVVAYLKADKLSGVVRQATELGVDAVHLTHARRCDVPRWSDAKLSRLRRVAAEASKQSGRAIVPDVTVGTTVTEETWSGTAWVAHPGASRTLTDVWAEIDPSVPALTIFTGPEGGFEDREVAALVGRGAADVCLGARILRAETAPIALASFVALASPW